MLAIEYTLAVEIASFPYIHNVFPYKMIEIFQDKCRGGCRLSLYFIHCIKMP